MTMPLEDSWTRFTQSTNHRSTIQFHDQGVKKLKRIDLAIRILAITSLALFALTIVFIGLAQAGYIYIQPFAALCSFGAILPTWIILKILDCYRQSVAEKHRVDLDGYDGIQLNQIRPRGQGS